MRVIGASYGIVKAEERCFYTVKRLSTRSKVMTLQPLGNQQHFRTGKRRSQVRGVERFKRRVALKSRAENSVFAGIAI
jgi:hypothetical protein